jgi:hypothetical protein
MTSIVFKLVFLYIKKILHLLLAALSSSWWLLSMEAGETESACLSVFEFSSILPRWDIGGDDDGDPGEPGVNFIFF